MSGPAGWSWSPTAEYVERANVTRLMGKLGLGTYTELIEWSLEDPSAYWEAVVEDLDITFDRPYQAILDDSDGPAWPRWFVGGKLNVARQCVDRPAAERPDSVALLWENEVGEHRAITYAELRVAVDAVAAELQERGVGAGDAVGLAMPMCPEAAFTMYAAMKLGGIAVPIFSGFSAEAIAARLTGAKAQVIAGCADTTRRGRAVALGGVVRQAAAACGADALFLTGAGGAAVMPGGEPRTPVVPTLSVESEHPLMLNYTSGTTGAPKAVVHVHGGFLVKVASEAAYLTDLHPEDTILWVTDLGWLMGPWTIVGAHAAGATVFLYEGAPDFPDPRHLWDVCRRHGVTVLGLSPTLARTQRAALGDACGELASPALRILASTGEPWDPETYEWLSRVAGGGSRPIVNISGGTEVGACFLGQPPVIATKTCSVGMPLPGMRLDVFSPEGEPIAEGVGELVAKGPWPAQTRGFWGQPERYLETYWKRWEGVWAHGDFASVDQDGYWFLHGRSDDTLNVAGKRIGPAEVEAAALQVPGVTECAVVGVPDPVKGEAIWCFCVVESESKPGQLEAHVRVALERGLGKPFASATVKATTALPKTRSGKVMRRLIRARVLGAPPGDLASLESTSTLDAIEEAIAG